MIATPPSSLDSASLARRLSQLAGDERAVQVEFLLHLDEFDRRRAYVDGGFGSLWEYCLRVLHLREGAAGRRIGAMRVLRRFPRLEPALRDGRLCVSTASLLGQVLTETNFDDLLERAAFKTKAEVEHLVVSIRPGHTPADGVRRLSSPAPQARPSEPGPLPLAPVARAAPAGSSDAPVQDASVDGAPGRAPPALPRPEARPVAEDLWSVRVTLDAAGKQELDALKALLSHRIPDGDLSAVLREAIRCGIEKHGKRKGAVAPARVRAAKPGSRSDGIPASIRRAVWARDGGQCTYVSPEGRRCESRWKLELDHIESAALGGKPTVANLRLRCRPHNIHHAEDVFGREHMEQFRRKDRDPSVGEPVARYAVG